MKGQADIVLIIRALAPYWEEAIDALAAAWENRGKITVVTGGGGEDALHPWKIAAGSMRNADVIVEPPLSHGIFGTDWPNKEIWNTLDRLNPALVVIHEYSPYVVLSGLLWANAAHRPCVISSDVGPVQRNQFSLAQKIAHRLINRAANGVLARTQDALDETPALNKRAMLAPHAIDTRRYSRQVMSGRVPNRIIQVGSLIPRKGVDLLLKAFAEAKKTRQDLELVLVGSGDHATARQLAEQLNVSVAVTIKKFLQPDELVKEYAQSDVFVLASRFDSYGVVVHEAAAAGMPLIVSKFAGASATLVVPGKNGFHVDPSNTAELAKAILESVDPTRNSELSLASKAIAAHFDVHAVAHRTAGWLEEVLQAWPTPSTTKKKHSRLLGGIRLVVDILKG